MLKLILYLPKCIILSFLVGLFLLASLVAGAEEISTVDLNLKYKALYITCCNFDGNGFKDIVVADDHNITIFEQNEKLTFKTITIRSPNRIIALNSCRIGKSAKEILICLGENKIFYYSKDNLGQIQGPYYIGTSGESLKLIQKQKTLKNFFFVIDLNSDGLSDIALPSENGLIIFWQLEPLVFKSSFVKINGSALNSFLNIKPWPKVGEKSQESERGLSFFPTISRKQYYWFQDYNKDGFLDILSLDTPDESYILSVYIQGPDREFRQSHDIKLQSGELRLLDVNNDGLLDIVEEKIEPPLNGNNSFLPLILTKIYLAKSLFEFDSSPKIVFKTVFIPSLDNVMDLNGDGYYEIISAPSPFMLGSKDPFIKVATNKEITFHLKYAAFDKTKNTFCKDIALNKEITVILPNLNEIGDSKHFVRFEDINGDAIYDLITLKTPSFLIIDNLKKTRNGLTIAKTINITLPCPTTEIKTIDINSDGKKELLLLNPAGKNLYLIHFDKI